MVESSPWFGFREKGDHKLHQVDKILEAESTKAKLVLHFSLLEEISIVVQLSMQMWLFKFSNVNSLIEVPLKIITKWHNRNKWLLNNWGGGGRNFNWSALQYCCYNDLMRYIEILYKT